MKTIHKKAYPALFSEVLSGHKTFDLRLADFDCQPGDILVLDEVGMDDKRLTGRSLRRKVGYVLKTQDLDFFAPEDVQTHGYQVMSLLPETTIDPERDLVEAMNESEQTTAGDTDHEN